MYRRRPRRPVTAAVPPEQDAALGEGPRQVPAPVASAYPAVRAAHPRVPPDEDNNEEDHDRRDGGGHEQENQLLAVQLNFAKAFVVHVLFSTPVI